MLRRWLSLGWFLFFHLFLPLLGNLAWSSGLQSPPPSTQLSYCHCNAQPAGAMMGRPSSPSCQRGKSLTEGACQIPDPGTNDSTLHQLKPPHPSHVEGPVSPRRLGLVTYPNPRPSSLTIPRKEPIKTTPSRVRGRTSSTCSGPGTPPGSA